MCVRAQVHDPMGDGNGLCRTGVTGVNLACYLERERKRELELWVQCNY